MAITTRTHKYADPASSPNRIEGLVRACGFWSVKTEQGLSFFRMTGEDEEAIDYLIGSAQRMKILGEEV